MCWYFARKLPGACFINMSRYGGYVGIVGSNFLVRDYSMPSVAHYHTRGAMRYINAVFVLAVALLAASHTLCICFSVSLLDFCCIPERCHSWSVLEVLLLRHAVHTVLAVCRMRLSAVFL